MTFNSGTKQLVSILDIHVFCCVKLSPLNEAGHLNGAETSAVAMKEAPSLLAAGVPKNSASSNETPGCLARP
jgi:hypothetical protein